MTAPVRFSHLMAYGRSAAHGHHARELSEDDPTYAMERGTALHALIFGTRKVLAYPGPVRRGKEYEAFCERNPDAEILTVSDYALASGMAESVSRSSVAAPYLQGVYEETLLFRWNGMDCRTTPDVRGAAFLTELKSTATADPRRFLWDARKRGYHAQLRFQEHGVRAAGKGQVRDHYIVSVESKPPYPVVVWHVEPEAILEADKLLTLWSEALKNSEASEAYPGYSDCVLPLVWPKDDEFIYGEAA